LRGVVQHLFQLIHVCNYPPIGSIGMIVENLMV